MKVLQLKECGVSIPPKRLEMGADFHSVQYYEEIEDEGSTTQYTYLEDNNSDFVCNLSDCYQSRPLIEIDGFCEFNIYMIDDNVNNVVLCIFNGYFLAFTFNGFRYDDRCKFTNLGSIFDAKNQAKYPEIYQEALYIIYKVGNEN
jgi:hypothetical protein